MGFLHALELTFDQPSDDWVRADWHALHTAGLPSRATATSPNNAPHVTVSNGRTIPASIDPIATEIFAPLLPQTVTVGGILLFGDDPLVLTRPIECSAELTTAVYEFKHRAKPLMTPIRDAFVPHITLSLRCRQNRVPEALAALQPTRDVTLTLTGLKRWDPDANQVHYLV